MGFRRFEMKRSLSCIPLFAVVMLLSVAFFCPVASSGAPEVELYQDEQGEWKVKYLDSKSESDVPAQVSDAEVKADNTDTTEIELYQDEKGEWKVRYNTTQAQAKAQEPVSAEPSTETAEKFDPSKDDVQASKDMLAEEPAEESDAAAEEPAFDVVDDEQDDQFKETANTITSESVVDAGPGHVEEVKTKPVKPTVSTSFEKENPSVYAGDDSESNRNPNHQWELGVDYSFYKFEQDEIVNNLDLSVSKTNKGNLAGIHLGYEHVLPEHGPYNSLTDLIKNIDDVSRYKVTLDYHTGQTEYSDNIGFPKEDFNQHIIDAKAVAGYDFKLKGNTRLTPFMGFGYRYVNDSSGGILDVPYFGIIDHTDDAEYSSVFFSPDDLRQPYTSQLHSFYLPIGLMTNSDISDDVSLGFNLEFDYVFLGIQRNSFSDLGVLYVEDSGTRTMKVSDLSNRLKSGIGLKASTRVTKKSKMFDWYIEPYVRYWHLHKNEKQYEMIISDGHDIVLYHDADEAVPYKHIEPDSSTTEYGIQIGLVY